MSVNLTTILSMSANTIMGVFGTALAVLIIWHNPRRRSNQFFALCMVLFALYGLMNTVWQAAQQFEMEPKPLFHVMVTVYIVATVLLFKFIFAFGEVSRVIRRVEWAISLPLGALFIGLLWADRLVTSFKPLSTGGYEYTVTALGLVGSALLVAYFVAIIGTLYHQRSPQARELAISVVLMAVGLLGFAASRQLRVFTINALMVTVAVVVLGHTVLKYRVFKPLADLNAELAAKNIQLAKATRMKSQFLANMSHELRTPLNSIIGYTELVTNRTYGDLTDLQEDRLRKVTRNGRMLLDLINDVLDLSKIEAGRLDLKPSRVVTADLLDDLLAELEPRAVQKGLSVVRGYSQLPPLYVDRDRARQILWNLITNAIKFTQAGAVIVRGYYDENQGQIVVIITDTGVGIAPEEREHIFDAFIRSEGLLTGQHDGTGLGLAIARRLTELHGGHLWFESEVGKGTTFYLALPAAEEPYRYVRQTLRPKSRSGGPIILAIDDDFEALEVIQDQLAREGLRVYGVSNPNDGLKLAHDLRPAVIMLDIMMPDMDGWQVLEALRRDPATHAIPVIIVSATDNADLARLAGADWFVRKPVDSSELGANVRRLLAQARADTRKETER